MSIIAAVLVFGLIILIHEFGHFIVAKKCGIGVVEFSIGMGPRLWSTEKGETRYSIKAFPFGGSCMMLGEDENESNPKAFNNKPVWARIAVVAAGPIFNFILAFVFGIIIVRSVGYDAPQLVDVQEGFPAQEQGMQAGDIITRLNNEPVVVYRDITLYRLHRGDLCMLSASCVLDAVTFDVFVDAEEDSECCVVSGSAFGAVSERNPDVRIFALETAVSRFSDVMWVMQQILFMSMDKRLAIFLFDESARLGSDTIELTHGQIARYMGSAREVVSRMLKYFAGEGIVEVSRGGVTILDKKRLRRLAL